jgi:acyl-CoA synthetase (AMP-forming)/AMP-acid ligase II
MRGLMMDLPLLLSGFIEYASEYHGDTEIVAREIEGDIHRYTYRQAHDRIKRLASALRQLGVQPGDRVGTLAWNTFRHFEMFYGVTGLGPVLHTVNPRLHPEQLIYIINHAEDRLLFVDAATIPVVEPLVERLKSVAAYVIMSTKERMPAHSLPNALCYEDLIAAESSDFAWPAFDERNASCICYTSGTTGNPKGVMYSHRANVLQTLSASSMIAMPGHKSGELESMMPIASMFHGNGWNMPFLACYTGSKLVLPGRNYQPEGLFELLDGERVTITAAVPTAWRILLDWLKQSGKRLTYLRQALASGSQPSRALIAELLEEHGVELTQFFGMTEALYSTVGTLKPGALALSAEEQMKHRMKSGRATFGVELRVVDDKGRELPKDGRTVGHLRVRGPWVATAYFKGEGGDPLDADGWLKTGDIGTLDVDGYVAITDREKDVIKSGGEWISSLELEQAAAMQPDVIAAAVIAIPHPKWQERPLMLAVLRPGSTLDAESLLAHLRTKVATWWLPDRIEFVSAIPLTATGKINKLELRDRYGGCGSGAAQ